MSLLIMYPCTESAVSCIIEMAVRAVIYWGEKDIVEKTLEGYNEVFADIVNVLLFKGERIIQPEDRLRICPGSR